MHELIYTSVPKGLASGSRGFCTVAATKSMSKSLSKKLEGLSGYNHVYDPGNSANPVNFSFVTLKDSGKTKYVLSRICDAGLDYTQRSNKFAHHISLDKGETPSAGPAWAFLSSGLFQVAWDNDQTPYHIDDGGSFPDGNIGPAVCKHWKKLLGDAGYGGVIAGQLANKAKKDIVIAYELGTDILTLISESLAIMPLKDRWQATFSTVAGKPNANYTCKLRCVLVGSEEARNAAGNKRVSFLDLTNPHPIGTEDEYVEAARSGKIVEPALAPVITRAIETGPPTTTDAPEPVGTKVDSGTPGVGTITVPIVEPAPRPVSIFDETETSQGGIGFGRIAVALSAMALLMLVLCGVGGGVYYIVRTQQAQAAREANDRAQFDRAVESMEDTMEQWSQGRRIR